MNIKKKNLTQNNRVIYFDYLRIMATIAVIVLHVAGQNFYAPGVNTYEWHVFNIYDSIVRWAVPIFVMISGALFLNTEKQLNIKALYTKNIFRILTAFIFWSLIYALTSTDRTLDAIVNNFINGHFHMWFLFMIVGLYMIIPILRKITESVEVTRYFLGIALIFTFLIPTLLRFPFFSQYTSVYNKLNFHITLGYSSYFILGYYLSKFELSRKKQNILCLLGLLGFISTIVLTAMMSLHNEKPYTGFYNNFSFNVMLQSIGVFVFTKYKLSKIQCSERFRKIIFQISKYSFGIYLVHALIIDQLNLLGLNTLSFNAILSVPIIATIVFAISILISFIINHIPILKKYIV